MADPRRVLTSVTHVLIGEPETTSPGHARGGPGKTRVTFTPATVNPLTSNGNRFEMQPATIPAGTGRRAIQPATRRNSHATPCDCLCIGERRPDARNGCLGLDARRREEARHAQLRSLAVSATNFTLFGLLKIAAATARQRSTSSPVQLPCESG